MSLVGGPNGTGVLADVLDLVEVTGVSLARVRGRWVGHELRAVAQRERRDIVKLSFQHRGEGRRGRLPHPGSRCRVERVHCAVPVVSARLQDQVRDGAAECHPGVFGVTVGNGRQRLGEPIVKRQLVCREEGDEDLVGCCDGGGLGIGAEVVECRNVGLVPRLGAVDGVVLRDVHDGQDPGEPERVPERLGAGDVVPVADDLTAPVASDVI